MDIAVFVVEHRIFQISIYAFGKPVFRVPCYLLIGPGSLWLEKGPCDTGKIIQALFYGVIRVVSEVLSVLKYIYPRVFNAWQGMPASPPCDPAGR